MCKATIRYQLAGAVWISGIPLIDITLYPDPFCPACESGPCLPGRKRPASPEVIVLSDSSDDEEPALARSPMQRLAAVASAEAAELRARRAAEETRRLAGPQAGGQQPPQVTRCPTGLGVFTAEIVQAWCW